jgi:hypothetical protein
MLAYLKFLWRSGMFVLLLFVFFSAYLAFTGSKISWAQDYATKNVSTVYRDGKYDMGVNKAPFFTSTILEGVYTTNFNQLREELLKIDSFEKRVDDYLQRKLEKEVSEFNNKIDKFIKNPKGDDAAKSKYRREYLSERIFTFDYDFLGDVSETAFKMLGYDSSFFLGDLNPAPNPLQEMEGTFGKEFNINLEAGKIAYLPFNFKSNRDNNQFVCDWLIANKCCEYEKTQSFYLTTNEASEISFDCIGRSFHTLYTLKDWHREILKSFFSLDKDLQQIILNTFDKATIFDKPWSFPKLFFADPKIALANFGMPASIFATFIGFFVWRAPLSWLRFPCKILRWPTPDDFNNSCQARNAWVERVFSETLFEMGINKTDILELSMGQTQS